MLYFWVGGFICKPPCEGSRVAKVYSAVRVCCVVCATVHVLGCGWLSLLMVVACLFVGATTIFSDGCLGSDNDEGRSEV